MEFEHGDEHCTNECIVDISQGDQSVALVMSPCLVWDSPEKRVSETDEIVLHLVVHSSSLHCLLLSSLIVYSQYYCISTNTIFDR